MMTKDSTNKFLIVSLVGTLSLGMCLPAQALLIRVAQESTVGAGDFDSNILGLINTYSTTGTHASFYRYDTIYPASFGGINEVVSFNTTNLFFVEASDGLGFYAVHDRPILGASGQDLDGMTAMRFELTGGDTASILLQDDPNNAFSDSFSNSEGKVFTTNNAFASCCTDGVVIGSIDGDDWAFFAEFRQEPFGIDSFRAQSNGSSEISLRLDTGLKVRFDLIPESVPTAPAVPTPTAVLPILSSLFTITRRQNHD